MEDKKISRLYDRLIEYCGSDVYPFHMPGHKRQLGDGPADGFPDPYSIDITEIEGFDNLHHPEGILRESMDWAAEVYGSDRTYYLVNGSTCGVLAAICAAAGKTPLHGLRKQRFLMARNSHRSAYHAAELLGIATEYIYPQILEETGLQGGLLPEEIEKMLITGEFGAVFITSPTYDGIVSDIRGIADACHRHGLPLIVDEAHGAHFPFSRRFPVSALDLGADIVIQSLHKTLPAFTQTAVLHARRGRVDLERLEHYLQIFQSSSPSYVFLAGIERCIRYMDGPGREKMEEFAVRLDSLRKNLRGMRHLRLQDEDAVGRAGVYALDRSKIIVSVGDSGLDGEKLMELLRNRYHLELEMCGPGYVTAITALMDTEEGLSRLEKAFLEIDGMADGGITAESVPKDGDSGLRSGERPAVAAHIPTGLSDRCRPQPVMTIRQAADSPGFRVKLEESAGCVSAEYVCLYPPGIPIVTPGERLNEEIIRLIGEYRRLGLPVQGLEDYAAEYIRVASKGQ